MIGFLGNQSSLIKSPVFKLIPSNGGEVGPPLSIYFTSSPINRIENALRDLEVLFPVDPCTVLKLNKTASPKLNSGIKIFFLNSFVGGNSIKALSSLYQDLLFDHFVGLINFDHL